MVKTKGGAGGIGMRGKAQLSIMKRLCLTTKKIFHNCPDIEDKKSGAFSACFSDGAHLTEIVLLFAIVVGRFGSDRLGIDALGHGQALTHVGGKGL